MTHVVLFLGLSAACTAASTHVAQSLSPIAGAPRLRVVSAHCLGCLVLDLLLAWWVL